MALRKGFKLREKFKRIKLNDLLSPIILIILIIPSLLYRVFNYFKKRKIILICEDPNEAKDNGYELFKYIANKGYNDVFYAISKKSPDKKKIEKIGKTINFYSLKHWLYYLSAYRNVSIHKAGSPAPALFYFLHKYKLFNGNRVFLQHGITMNKVDYLHQNKCNFKYFITAGVAEHEFVIKELGYTEESSKLLGFSRFDRLYDKSKESNYKNMITIMPTWRSYLRFHSNEEFKETEYFQKYNELLNNKKLIEIIENENIQIFFYLHRNFQQYRENFKSRSKNIIIADPKEVDIQSLISDSKMLITDYSSISFDFAYMGKPILYYQFDQKSFFKKHLESGYFSYKKDGFGEVVKNLNDLLREIKKMELQNFKTEEKYLEKTKKFFKYIDNNNNERIYKLLIKDITKNKRGK